MWEHMQWRLLLLGLAEESQGPKTKH